MALTISLANWINGSTKKILIAVYQTHSSWIEKDFIVFGYSSCPWKVIVEGYMKIIVIPTVEH